MRVRVRVWVWVWVWVWVGVWVRVWVWVNGDRTFTLNTEPFENLGKGPRL